MFKTRIWLYYKTFTTSYQSHHLYTLLVQLGKELFELKESSLRLEVAKRKVRVVVANVLSKIEFGKVQIVANEITLINI